MQAAFTSAHTAAKKAAMDGITGLRKRAVEAHRKLGERAAAISP
jgi:hypothetical protein